MRSYNTSPITLFPPGDEAKDTDVYIGVDTTDLSESPSGTTKKYTNAQLAKTILSSIDISNIKTARVSVLSDLDASYFNGPEDDGVGATLTNIGTLAPLVVDSVPVLVGDRVIVSFQTSSFENGVYTVTSVGSISEAWVLTRAEDFDGSSSGQFEAGKFLGCLEGVQNSLSFWFLTNTPDSIGVDPILIEKQSFSVSEQWVNQTDPTIVMSVNTGYTNRGGATQTNYILPITASVGDYVEINGNDIGSYRISQLGPQTIHFGTDQTSTGPGGQIIADDQFCNIRIRCTESDNVWTVVSFVGSFTIV